jgi:hypothetical protein
MYSFAVLFSSKYINCLVPAAREMMYSLAVLSSSLYMN